MYISKTIVYIFKNQKQPDHLQQQQQKEKKDNIFLFFTKRLINIRIQYVSFTIAFFKQK